MTRLLLLLSFVMLCLVDAKPQNINQYLGDETTLYAQTKQVNQFFRRFNGEESSSGQRFRVEDPNFRNITIRKRYLQMIFDLESPYIDKSQRSTFIDYVTDRKEPVLLNFHTGDWFAEVTTRFLFYGKEENVTLFLKLEEENLGYKWVITNVFFKPFHDLFTDEDDGKMRFLHPLSHELDFMNLIKIFRETQKVAQYAASGYKPDYLSMFLYELKRGNLSFQTVRNVKFHFFQVPGWYFELSEIRRSGPNSGWLVTGLVDISEIEKDILLKYIYYE
jgi:hypothetical protein